MPTEIREIAFSSAELSSAISDFYLRQSLHQGREILKVVVNGDIMTPVNITIYDKETDQRFVESLSKAEVAAALITYCRRTHVMMPRRSRKSVAIKNNQMVLTLRLASGNSAEDSPFSSLGT